MSDPTAGLCLECTADGERWPGCGCEIDELNRAAVDLFGRGRWKAITTRIRAEVAEQYPDAPDE